MLLDVPQRPRQLRLIPAMIAERREIMLERLTFHQVSVTAMEAVQPLASRAIWRPAPGRKMAYTLQYDGDVIGLLFLASPVINLAVRDEYLGLSRDAVERGGELRHYMDLSICVGLQPLAWYWNLGKLLAMIAPTLGTEVEDRYGDELRGIITTSLFGKGSQYNRVYKFLGYTKGYGHEHITDDMYMAMLDWMRREQVEIPSTRFGAGPNARMRRIAAFRRASGMTNINLQHGYIRGVYYKERVSYTWRDAASIWYRRWGYPRWLRVKDNTPPYETGLDHRQEDRKDGEEDQSAKIDASA